MFKVYFSDFKTGQLNRLPYLGYAVVLGVILFVFMSASVAAIVGVEKTIGGNLMETQQLVTKYLGLPFVITLMILVLTLFIAGLNITAKRARNVGLPGWVFIAGYIAASILIFRFISQEASQAFNAIILIGLLLVPANSFKGRQA